MDTKKENICTKKENICTNQEIKPVNNVSTNNLFFWTQQVLFKVLRRKRFIFDVIVQTHTNLFLIDIKHSDEEHRFWVPIGGRRGRKTPVCGGHKSPVSLTDGQGLCKFCAQLPMPNLGRKGPTDTGSTEEWKTTTSLSGCQVQAEAAHQEQRELVINLGRIDSKRTWSKDTNAFIEGLQHTQNKHISPQRTGGMQQCSALGPAGHEQDPPLFQARSRKELGVNPQASGEQHRKVPEQ